MNEQQHSFDDLGIAPKLLEVLKSLNISTPSPIQERSIPHGIAGQDVIGIAQTGTGKTIAFGIPLLQSISKNGGQALVLLPTRELALQVFDTLGKFAKPLGLRGAVLIGGTSMNPQISDLRRNPHVIIATPGRLLDHLAQRTIRLDGISILVLDEADRMLDMGFWPQIKKIIASLPKERQTMLFSATASKEIMQLAQRDMKTPISVEVAPSGTTAEKVSQEFFVVHKNEKMRMLESVLATQTGSAIIFVRTKYGATRIMKGIQAMGHTSAEIHSNRSLNQRRHALESFKMGRVRVLVATDIAARGLDVKGVALVLNYDMPSQAEDYVHRIGRTARAGAEGHAISFVMPEERRDMRDIERLIRMPIPLSVTPSNLPPARALPSTPYIEEPHRNNRGFQNGRPQRAFNSFPRNNQRSGQRTFSRGNTGRRSSFSRPQNSR